MVKKVVRSNLKKREKPVTLKKNRSCPGVEKILIENFVSLQKVMTNLSIKFDNLTKQISKLLELFEISAKTLAEKDLEIEKKGSSKKVIEKIDNLLEQNKIIARGLTLIHEKVPEQQLSYPAPLQNTQQVQQRPKPQAGIEGYQKSISSKIPSGSSATQFPKK